MPKRILKETERLTKEAPPGISATSHEDNLRYFDVVIAGPQSSPYEGTSSPLASLKLMGLESNDKKKKKGGSFKLELFLPDDYPMAPPKVRFLTKIYHPNIDKLGRICLDILSGKPIDALTNNTDANKTEKWSPALQIRTVLLSIQALLSAPNPDDPLANDVANAWKENEKLALQTAKEWTQKFAV